MKKVKLKYNQLGTVIIALHAASVNGVVFLSVRSLSFFEIRYISFFILVCVFAASFQLSSLSTKHGFSDISISERGFLGKELIYCSSVSFVSCKVLIFRNC